MRLYNTLSKKVEEFEPLDNNRVKIFVCGPTVYDNPHIGHAKTYTQFDILARTLRYFGYKVEYLQNITDIDDKIIARANESGIAWQELTETYKKNYLSAMSLLGNDAVNHYAKATDHIEDIKKQVRQLLDKGHAYTIDGDGIYFEVSKFADYGKLAGRTDVKENDSLSRIDQSDKKRGWNDFCLWKFSKLDEPVWPAEFGEGRPGWHIEDTAITEHYFGQQYDIHGGAIDLIFPHHEAEIAQMEAISGLKPFVKYWVHTGFLNLSDSKMSKSANNFFTIEEVVNKVGDPQALRMLFLQAHYKSEQEFTFKALDQASNRLRKLKDFASLRWQAVDYSSEDEIELIVRAKHEIEEAMADDLNTPVMLRVLAGVQDGLESGVSSDSLKSLNNLLEVIRDTTGLDLLVGTPDISDNQKSLLRRREAARETKDFKLADNLRQQLADQHIQLRDTEHGALWQRT